MNFLADSLFVGLSEFFSALLTTPLTILAEFLVSWLTGAAGG